MSDIEVDDLGSSEWESKIMDEKRYDLIELFKFGKVHLSESGELLQDEYKKALEQCVFDPNNHKEKTILHCLINQYKPFRVIEGGKPGKFEPQRFYALVDVFLKAIADRLGEKGLYDTLHRAIDLKHFKLLESICKKMEDSKLTRLISNGISFSDSSSSRNCLRAIILTDPRNISLVKTLVHYAELRAFQPENSGDGNTPLHDFVSFGAKNLRINRCACHECLRTYPDLIIDEKQYTDEYVKVLQMMIKKFPGALSTANKEGETPYTIYKKTRPATIDGKPLDGLEFGCDDPPQDLDAARGDTAGKALLPDEPAEINMLRRTNTSGDQHSQTTKKFNSKKGQSTKAGESQPETQSKPGEHENWVYSRYLAQSVGIELLESSCSLPSWEKASQAIFGTSRDKGQSVFQTHLKMEEALYDGIESAHNFLEFNPILACVELRLANLGQESASSEDPFDTGDLPMRRHMDSVAHRLTPEQTRDENEKYLGDLLKWLREKGVKKILKLVVIDDQDLQCRDETIQNFLIGWDVRYLDWNKQDLSIDVITAGKAHKLIELWLTWSGRNSVLIGWSDPVHGLKNQLRMLREVHTEAYSSVESISRMKQNLILFKQRIESANEREIVTAEAVHGACRLKFELPSFIRPRPNGQEAGHKGAHWAKENQNNHRWMEAVKNFQYLATSSYTSLRPGSRDRKDLDERPIKVALIDDGVNPSKLQSQLSLKKGWPPNIFHSGHRNVSTYYNSSEGHGTTMANLILTVCPLVHLYVAKLERQPPTPFTSVLQMAAEAVKWAISEEVDVISMSWTIKPENQNRNDITALGTQIHRAGTAGISLFCSSDDIGSHATVSTLLPAPNEFLRRVGSCDGNGLISDFVTASQVHYLFPGEQLPIMHHYLKGKSSREAGDQGSSASTALASGLAALILWCAVRSGCDKKEFANERMYGVFDKLKVDQGLNKGPSLVDVSGIMNTIREDSVKPIKAVEAFIDRLKKECIPQQLREYHQREKAALK